MSARDRDRGQIEISTERTNRGGTFDENTKGRSLPHNKHKPTSNKQIVMTLVQKQMMEEMGRLTFVARSREYMYTSAMIRTGRLIDIAPNSINL